APCTGRIPTHEYMKTINEVLDFLSGKDNKLLRSIEEDMKKASADLDFEKAIELRNEIFSIKKIREKQKMISATLDDEDVIVFSRIDNNVCIEVFFVREGKLLGRENFYFEDIEDDGNLIYSFITQFYSSREYVPREVLLQEEIPEINIIESFLSNKRGSKVRIKIPKRGDKNQIIEMAKKNAQAYLEQVKYKVIKEKQQTIGALEEIQAILSLDKLPLRIESYDISNIQGTDAVGSMVVFENGKPIPKDYRRFKIKTIKGPNDYGSMYEILSRRFERGINEINSLDNKGKFSNMPDLILMDGGLGQVNIAIEVLTGLSLDIPVCGMVKDSKHRTRGLIYENTEINILKDCNAFKLITRIQDEVHRTAITYHRSLRSKALTVSELDNISGIGDKRKKVLLTHFKDIENIKKARIEDILEVKGMNKLIAQNIINYFSN
ncbi:MAG: excinuclease ABC subunit UvrC, partial [Clostridium sp.]